MKIENQSDVDPSVALCLPVHFDPRLTDGLSLQHQPRKAEKHHIAEWSIGELIYLNTRFEFENC